MLLDALNLTTGSFTALDADASQEVFETLITVGDRVRDSDRDRLPLPPSGLIADVYGETILSCLRGGGFDLALVRDRLEDYDVEDICRDSRWVGERELLNTRRSVGRLVASLRAEDDAGKRGMLLSGYRAPALILADLGAYVRSVIEALGPSFLETVAEDVARGDYEPLAETVDGRPTGLLVPDDAREAAQLTAATTAATATGRKRSRVVELARAAGPGSGGAGPSSRGKGKAPASNPAPAAVPDETAAPIARSKAAKAKLARANASVPDPLAAALAASGRDASGAGPSSRGGAAAMWTTLNRHLDDEAAEETETEEAEEVEGDDDSNGEPSPAAVAAQRRKMNITAHRKPNATTVAWDDDEEDEDEDAGEDARGGAGGGGADGARGAKRRYNKWSKDEIEALKGLVGEFGVGNWQDITREGKRRGEFKEHLHPNTVREKWYYLIRKAARK